MTSTSVIFGNDVSTFPDYPAEIRAPVGTLAGVSGFQLCFGSHKLRTPGDRVNALIAMNPAALKANIADLEHAGILIVNEDAFVKVDLDRELTPTRSRRLGHRRDPPTACESHRSGHGIVETPQPEVDRNAPRTLSG
jgi:Pyruvate/2-oxoacid:ferredoxin oxidoreductase gamma subunit